MKETRMMSARKEMKRKTRMTKKRRELETDKKRQSKMSAKFAWLV
jgi:hypothetical protein